MKNICLCLVAAAVAYLAVFALATPRALQDYQRDKQYDKWSR